MTRSGVFRASGWCLHALCAIGILVGGPPTRAENGCHFAVLPTDGTVATAQRLPSTRARFIRAVYLITPSEVAASGLPSGTGLVAIGFHYSNSPGVAATGSLQVYLENTSDTTNNKSTSWATAISGMTLVHDDTTTLPDTSDPFDIPFSGSGTSSFTYTGGGLYVALDWSFAGPVASQVTNWANLSLPGGIKSNMTQTAPPANLASTAATRPETWLTPSVPLPGELANDASVDYVISLGSVAKLLVSPQAFQAVITNHGYHGQTNLPVSLNVTGTQPFSDAQTIASLGTCGAKTTVTFASFIPMVNGSNTITVSIPTDDNDGNNASSVPFDVTDYLYSYLHPGMEPNAGVTADPFVTLAAKFPITVAAKVSQIHLYFYDAIGTFRSALYADSGSGTPASMPIYEDATDHSVLGTGPVTITLPTPVDVGPGNFYAGYFQTSTETIIGGTYAEDPLRPNTFFATLFSPGQWFEVGQGPFVFTVGVTFAQCTTDAECDDGNPCTDDACTEDWTCGHTDNNASCDDGNACTLTDTCQAGACTGSNYSWSGVLQPVNAEGTSVFKLGSTIPTKFKLTAACAGNPDLLATIYFYQVTGSEGPVNEAFSTSAADTGTTFRYSASGDQYIYNLGTKGLTSGTWHIGIDLHDGAGIRMVSVGLKQ